MAMANAAKTVVLKGAGNMAALQQLPLRCVTVDVTGTLMGYKGVLGDYYCMAAKAVGLPCPDYERMHMGFKLAYKEMATKYPCFGKTANLSNVDWWRMCVRNSFLQAGYDYDKESFDQVFRRIYSMFGSAAPYTLYPDAQPFLRWVRKQGILVGIVSNASYRYRDIILPTLGLNKDSEWDFGVFSGIEGVEKPDPEIFKIAVKAAGNICPEQILHIGDNLRKDYQPARSLGMRALLIDRFSTPEAHTAKETGVPVVADLLEAQEYITSMEDQIAIS